jgi:hypothetical protein
MAYRTVEDFINGYYGNLLGGTDVRKDDPAYTSTTGLRNVVYGRQTWINLNLEANAFGVLPKMEWKKSGWRAITARASDSVTGGIAESSSAIPATVKFTYAEVSANPKLVSHTSQNSDILELLNKTQEDVTGDKESMKEALSKYHVENLNKMLLTDNDTLAGDNVESLDRIVGSYAEIAACGQTANDLDIYGLNRDAAATWADATVLHNSNTDRVLSESLYNSLWNTVHQAGGTPNFWLTGWDTNGDIMSIESAKGRLERETEVTMTMNGVKTIGGQGAGFKFNSLFGLPIILSKDCVKDTKSRLYLLDTTAGENGEPKLGVGVLRPTTHFEAGMSTGNPFSIDYFGDKFGFVTECELVQRFFPGCGKIRDLK